MASKDKKAMKCTSDGIRSLVADSNNAFQEHYTAAEKRGKGRRKIMRIDTDTDALSKLPDDILVYMLSFVDMKTAGRTSLLSKRWRYVWTSITHLDFKDPKYFNKGGLGDSLRCGPYCKWVNNVTTASCAPTLHSMRIHFPICRNHNDREKVRSMEFQLWLYVHRWIKFGLRKKVVKLELNMATATAHKRPVNDWSILFYMNRPNLSHFKTNWKSPHLKYLHLEALCVDGPLIEKVLSNCLNLEQLIVKYCAFKSNNLAAAGVSPSPLWSYNFGKMKLNMKIRISSLKLKHLEFDGCNIELFQISAPKLTSLVLIPLSTTTTMPEVEYTSVPSLVDVTFVSSYCFHIFNTSDFSLYTLEKLSLCWDQICNIRLGFPNLCEENAMISIIEACPLLHTFKLELHSKWYAWRKQGARLDAENAIAHEHLKVIEIVGYDGTASVDRLALSLTHPMHTPKLNKIIIDPCSPPFMHKYCDTQLMRIIGLARARAKLLANQIPGGVDMLIL